MGRDRSYDEDHVLGEAMHVFRRDGYGAASIRDLERASGLTSGSLYHGFSDKAGLFDAAFAHYNQVVLQGRIDRYAPKDSGIPGLRKLFTTLLQEPDGQCYGCLITNAAIELGGRPKGHPRVTEALTLLQETLVARLAAARRTGELAATIDPEVKAIELLSFYQGVLVLIRAGYDKSALRRAINGQFDCLEARHDT